jgi:hypothetical protein
MGQVLLALSKADLLDPDKMFAEGQSSPLPLVIMRWWTGEKKSMFLSRLPGNKTAPHRQVDIRLCPTESLPYMLLGNSGDDMLMKLLRWRAIAKGWTLNEYGMGERTEDVVSSLLLFSRVMSRWWGRAIVSLAWGSGLTLAFPVEGTEIIVKDEQEIFDKVSQAVSPLTRHDTDEQLGVPYLEASLSQALWSPKCRFSRALLTVQPHQRKYAHYRTLKHFKNMDI